MGFGLGRWDRKSSQRLFKSFASPIKASMTMKNRHSTSGLESAVDEDAKMGIVI